MEKVQPHAAFKIFAAQLKSDGEFTIFAAMITLWPTYLQLLL